MAAAVRNMAFSIILFRNPVSKDFAAAPRQRRTGGKSDADNQSQRH
jgi:hypothetical protein